MAEKLKNMLGCPVPPQERTGFYDYLLRTNYWPTLAIGTLIMVFEAVMIALSLIGPGGFGQSPTHRRYFNLYVILFAGTAAFVAIALIFRGALRRKPRVFQTMCHIYAFLICVWGSLLSAYAHRSSPDITVFIYVVLCVSTIMMLQLWQSILLFGSNLLIFCLLVPRYAGPDVRLFGSFVNGLIVTMLAIAVATILYRTRAKNYLNSLTIMQQSEKIRTINEQLQALVHTDSLTQAKNRRFFEEVLPNRLHNKLEEGQTVSILMLDIDHFKEYNDIYGHQAGDACLQMLASLVREEISPANAHFIRYGGEEFVLFIAGLDEGGAVDLAERIRAQVDSADVVHAGSPKGNLTISVGVFVWTGHSGVTLQRLVHNADQALYIAKNSGRNRVELYSGHPDESVIEAKAMKTL